MLKAIIDNIRSALSVLIIMAILTGLAYPGAITLLAKSLFPEKANGSLLVHNGEVIGSKLIGQNFSENRYFWGRPSATKDFPYNALHSAGSNLGPTNPLLLVAIKARIDMFRKADPRNTDLIPVDLVTASSSGLDPEISPRAALYQINRIARAHGYKSDVIRRLINLHIEKRQFGFMGEPRVNVLELNLFLDALASGKEAFQEQ
jgi:potassium-transporting ATPase KdpC subunit